MRGARGMVAAALCVAAAAAGAFAGKTWYAYDAAGRLVRETDGSGRFREWGYDGAGNITSSGIRRLFHASVKKPAAGAWAFGVDEAGAVSGFGADAAIGSFRIAGTVDLSGAAPTGTIEIRDPDTDALLETFALAGGKVTRDAANAPLSVAFAGTGATTTLAATAVRPAGAFGAFHGTFANPKSSVKAGTVKAAPGLLVFFAEGTRPALTRLHGEVEGLLVRDPKGNAWGEVTYDGDAFLVQAKVKDGAKSVTVKSVKGAPVPFTLKVKK